MTARLRTDEKIFTSVDVARLINVHVTSVANWIRQGILQSYRTPGGHNRITRSALLKFLNEQKIPIPEALAGDRFRVLVVDDDAKVARLIADALTDESDTYEVTTVGNGIEALLAIGKELPDLIVLDLFMPELDGFEVCKRIKENPERSHLRILGISGETDSGVGERILACGADAFLQKPLDMAEFLSKIRELASA